MFRRRRCHLVRVAAAIFKTVWPPPRSPSPPPTFDLRAGAVPGQAVSESPTRASPLEIK